MATPANDDDGEVDARTSSSRDADHQHSPLHSSPGNDDADVSTASRLKRWLFDLMQGTRALKNGKHRKSDLYKKRLIAVSLLAVLIAAFLKRRRRQRLQTASSPKSHSVDSFIWPLGFLIDWWKGPDYNRSPQESTMSLLWLAARDGVIQRALIGSSAIFFQTKQKEGTTAWNRALLPTNNESIKTGILEALAKGGCSDISAIPESIWSKLAGPVLAALPFVYLALLYRMMKNQFGGQDISSKLTNGTRKLWGEEERDRTTFADVAGLELVIEDMSEVAAYLANPSLYKTMGARPPRGVLLHGPPGSGKTLLARAVAGEAMCDSFTALSGSSFVEMYVGRGAARVRSLFAKARRDARQRQKLKRAASWWSSFFGFASSADVACLKRPPCAILFIDELDAVAKSRSSDSIHGNDEREQTLNQLLTEMDGFDSGDGSRENKDEDVTLIVIAASNRIDVIDEAVLRRFDRQILVGYPNEGGRKAILLVHAKKIACAPDIDWDELASAQYTDNFSGADLRNVVNEAALFAIREKKSVVDQSHMLHAVRRIGKMKSRTSRVQATTPLPMFFTNID